MVHAWTGPILEFLDDSHAKYIKSGLRPNRGTLGFRVRSTMPRKLEASRDWRYDDDWLQTRRRPVISDRIKLGLKSGPSHVLTNQDMLKLKPTPSILLGIK